MAFREKVKRAREARGLSKAALARALGVAPSTVTRLESGERMPSAGLLRDLARELSLDLNDLLGVDTAPPAAV
jgi:transcriptional regulator with XRE-family HTH domain